MNVKRSIGSCAFVACLLGAVLGCGREKPLTKETGQGTAPTGAVGVSKEWDAHISTWKHELRASATSDADVAFPTPPQAELESRLAAAASEFDFQVISVEFVSAPQGSPVVIVESSDPQRFSNDTPAIFHRLDPQQGGGEDWQGWDYEGFFLGAQDADRDPFLAVYNFERAHGGGQWARSENLLPFAHG
jgi:hypothetical protein